MDKSVIWGYINVIYKRLPPAAAVNWMRGDHEAQVPPIQSTSFPAYTQVPVMRPKGVSAPLISRNKFSNITEVFDQLLGQSFTCL